MKKWLIYCMCMASTSVFAQETIKLTAGKHNDFGLTYNLPNTMADINIQVTKVTATAGPYYKYAEKYLGVQEIVTENMQYWEMNDIQIKPVGISNPEETYLIEFRSGSAPTMYLNENGNLLSINTEPQASSVADNKKQPATKKNESTTPSYSVLSEEQLTAGSTAKMAEMAAKQIYRIRESRLNLATGDVDQLPADGESFKLIMKQLDDQEAALTAMFLGTIKKEQISKTIRINPAEKTGKSMLFRFSKYLGIVDNENLSGVPVYLNTEITEDLRPQAEEAKKKKKHKGVTYNVPGKVKLTISTQNKTLTSAEFGVAQFGYNMQFPTNMFDDKKAPAKAIFSPETGAILEILQ